MPEPLTAPLFVSGQKDFLLLTKGQNPDPLAIQHNFMQMHNKSRVLMINKPITNLLDPAFFSSVIFFFLCLRVIARSEATKQSH